MSNRKVKMPRSGDTIIDAIKDLRDYCDTFLQTKSDIPQNFISLVLDFCNLRDKHNTDIDLLEAEKKLMKKRRKTGA